MSTNISEIRNSGLFGKMQDMFQPDRIETKKPLWQRVKELEEIQQKSPSELGEARATMIVNFGPEGRAEKGLVTPDMSLVGMLVSVVEFYMKKSEKGEK
jgi:hypothetical protein